jgi:outer membrane protein OmpA-like peptidoglycan-associated protein
MVENRLNNLENTADQFSDLSPDEFEILNELSRNRHQAMLLKQKYASTLLTKIAKTPNIIGAVSITGQLIDNQTGSSLHGARVLLTNEFGEILKMTQTNEQGQFRFTDVTSETQLFLRLENASGHVTNAKITNIRMMGSDNQNSLYVENVYFDFDHYLIRPEAAQVLGQLADYLKGNPGAQVEIYSFADDRGSTAYNFELTQKRGEAVVAYLARNGVDATSLAIIPKGKQAIKRSETEAQRQYNRRVEFYINGIRETFSPSVKTYILKKEVNWNYLSKQTGISREQLKALNGSEAEDVKAFQPVRLPIDAKSISNELFFVGL